MILAMVLLLLAPPLLPSHRTLTQLVSWHGSRGVEDVSGRVLMNGVPWLGLRNTYWVLLENHPGWAWARGVQRVFLGFERPPGVVDLGPLRAAGLP